MTQGFAQVACTGLVKTIVETTIDTGVEPVMPPKVQFAVAVPAAMAVAVFPETGRVAGFELKKLQRSVMKRLGTPFTSIARAVSIAVPPTIRFVGTADT